MKKSIGQIVAEDYRSAAIFDRYGIDFCCNGEQSLETVCEQRQIDIDELRKLLHHAIIDPLAEPMNYNSWPLDLLTEFIENKHHRYAKEKILVINQHLNEICMCQGAQHPELYEINEIFITSSLKLAVQMEKEELVLFPYIRKMFKAKYNSGTLNVSHFAPINIHVLSMINDHRIEGKRLRKIEALSRNYTPPEDTCNTTRIAFALLQEFYKDLQIHIHLENNILFPKATNLEKEIGTSA